MRLGCSTTLDVGYTDTLKLDRVLVGSIARRALAGLVDKSFKNCPQGRCCEHDGQEDETVVGRHSRHPAACFHVLAVAEIRAVELRFSRGDGREEPPSSLHNGRICAACDGRGQEAKWRDRDETRQSGE